MRIITLSDHVSDMIKKIEQEWETAKQAARQKWERANQATQKAHQDALVERQRRLKHLGQSLSDTWRNKQYGKLLFTLIEFIKLSFSSPPTPSVEQPARVIPEPAELEIWRGGKRGEDYVKSTLSSILDDNWTYLGGYRSSKGEIDAVLIGEPGVFAIEIKNLRGDVSIDGDKWTRDIYDRWDNLKERADPIADGKRSPSQQLNDAAVPLQNSLSHFDISKIYRLVVLAYEGSKIVSAGNLTIDAVVLPNELSQTLWNIGQMKLNAERRDQIVRLIQDNHRQFEVWEQSQRRTA